MSDKKKQKQVSPEKANAIMEKSLGVVSMMAAGTDPNGSYTGVAENPYEKPVQDVDDL